MGEYFTREEVIDDIINMLEDISEDGEWEASELHNAIFNSDYYLDFEDEAQSALEEYGVFKAIRYVKAFENDTWAEDYTDYSDPIKLANMLHYAMGYNAMFNNEISKEFSRIIYDNCYSIDEIVRNELLEELKRF